MYTYLSCFNAYSNIFILLTKSFFRFSWPFLSPCKNAIRAWKHTKKEQKHILFPSVPKIKQQSLSQKEEKKKEERKRENLFCINYFSKSVTEVVLPQTPTIIFCSRWTGTKTCIVTLQEGTKNNHMKHFDLCTHFCPYNIVSISSIIHFLPNQKPY